MISPGGVDQGLQLFYYKVFQRGSYSILQRQVRRELDPIGNQGSSLSRFLRGKSLCFKDVLRLHLFKEHAEMGSRVVKFLIYLIPSATARQSIAKYHWFVEMSSDFISKLCLQRYVIRRHQSRGILTGKSFEFWEEQQKKKRLQKVMLRSNNSPQKCVSSVLLLLDVCEEENWLSSMVYSFI